MIENLPNYVSIIFAISTLISIFFVVQSARYHSTQLAVKIIIGLLIWSVFLGIMAYTGFFLEFDTTPPRFALIFAPPTLFITYLFLRKKSREALCYFSMPWLTYLHIVRVPVELVLWWLFLNKQVPEFITFEGYNWDILSGITAPFIAFTGILRNGKWRKGLLWIWNILTLALLINVVVAAVLSAPLPIQQFAFDQPNVAVAYFPFIWLPGVVVPIVLFAHLVAFLQLLHKK